MKLVFFALFGTLFLPSLLNALVSPNEFPNAVSFIKVACPSYIVTGSETYINVTYVSQGSQTCYDGTPNEFLTYFNIFGFGPTGAFSLNGPNCISSGLIYNFTIPASSDGTYDITASFKPPNQAISSTCSFKATHQKETQVPELNAVSLLAVLLSVFGLLGFSKKVK